MPDELEVGPLHSSGASWRDPSRRCRDGRGWHVAGWLVLMVQQGRCAACVSAEVVYGLAVVGGSEGEGVVFPLAAAALPGSGRLEVLVNGTGVFLDCAKAALLCVRRLRGRLELRDLWAPDVDLYLGGWWVAVAAQRKAAA